MAEKLSPHSADSRTREERMLLVSMIGRITIYYGIIALLLAAALAMAPGLLEYLPVGGIEDIVDPTLSAVRELDPTFREGITEGAFAGGSDAAAASDGRFSDARHLLFAMIGTVLLMTPVAWVYKCIHYTGEHDHSLDETAFVLPSVVAGIVAVVQHSLALAFSLAGIVAGVRFRRALQDTFDTLFIFVAIGVGIAAGIEALDIAAVMSMFFNYATLGVCAFGDGLESHHKRNKKKDKREKRRAAEARLEAEREAAGKQEEPS
ncbi:MAG: DUF4956 domain-containing protein [Pseudomonadota bacterium]